MKYPSQRYKKIKLSKGKCKNVVKKKYNSEVYTPGLCPRTTRRLCLSTSQKRIGHIASFNFERVR